MLYMGRQGKWVEAEFLKFKEESRAKEKADKESHIRRMNKLSPQNIVDMLVSGEISSSFTNHLYTSRRDRRSWEIVGSHINDKKSRFVRFKDDYIKILKILSKKSPTFFDYEENTKTLDSIAEYLPSAIREISDWSPRRTARYQLSDLLRYLFCKYDPPKFLDKGFITGDMEMIELFLHIGSGRSLRKFPLLPELVFNSKAYNYILNCPYEDINYFEACRRAQILSMGGSEYLSSALLGTRIATRGTERTESFWITVIKFFVDNPMIEYNKVREIFDYIYHLFANNRNTSMKGRTPDALLRQSDEWHRQQAAVRGAGKYPERWKPQNLIGDGEYIVGNALYKIIQLTSRNELVEEGKVMSHCVGSYVSSCVSGQCSIFSLRKIETEKINQRTGKMEAEYPLVTIEVRNNQIVQARGKFNAKPTEGANNIMQRWAHDEKLTISRYI